MKAVIKEGGITRVLAKMSQPVAHDFRGTTAGDEGWLGRGKWVNQDDRSREIALLKGVADRDTAAFRELVRLVLPMVVNVARRMLGDESEADDVAQEAMIRLWDQGQALEQGGNGARPWLRRVTANLCIDRIRSRKKFDPDAEVPEIAERATQLGDLIDRDLATQVDRALQDLPERQRLALTLFHYEGLSQLEIGEILGVTDEAVESLLARARRRMRTLLAEDWRNLLDKDG